MATKLQQLLEELKELKPLSKFNVVGYKLIEKLITKYTETTTTYNPRDKEITYTEEEVKSLLIKFSMDYCDVHPKNVEKWFNREKK